MIKIDKLGQENSNQTQNPNLNIKTFKDLEQNVCLATKDPRPRRKFPKEMHLFLKINTSVQPISVLNLWHGQLSGTWSNIQ